MCGAKTSNVCQMGAVNKSLDELLTGAHLRHRTGPLTFQRHTFRKKTSLRNLHPLYVGESVDCALQDSCCLVFSVYFTDSTLKVSQIRVTFNNFNPTGTEGEREEKIAGEIEKRRMRRREQKKTLKVRNGKFVSGNHRCV